MARVKAVYKLKKLILNTFRLGAFFVTHAVSWHIIALFNIFRFTGFHRVYLLTDGFFLASWCEANFFSANSCPTFLSFNFVTAFRNGLPIDSLTNSCLKIKKNYWWIMKKHFSNVLGLRNLQEERAFFQTFWKLHCCPNFLFFEIETSNFGYLLIFKFSLTVQSFRKIGQHLY